ncbi:hypothetical protein CEUSTIGMA_g1601.t1 [Chlamydomonas eustigma]|uniref:RING-type E3 ubiquitin transferase n=1 Tax=Chlamydomonas eustigma TaxID=1157962 RepID=A0A250WU49_9CHLO|nr:hypothetical protein CEUSTIGMA_g1601.t1 [Chlamydomonas eustigma]|eukprot:GAX74152.1 hypothetical protein CEUSTIGMA_g1601.t1 [Chlamydomonas eustigma]
MDVQSDSLIERVFAVTLRHNRENLSSDPPVLHLAQLSKELEADGVAIFMNGELLDRILVSRLIESPPSKYPLSPLQYLLGCHARASNELRTKAVSESPILSSIVLTSKELIVSYAGLALQGVIPQEQDAEQRGSLQLLDSLDAKDMPAQGIVPMPHGFIDEFGARHENDGLEEWITPIVKELARRVRSTSPLGNYAAPLSIVAMLCRCEPIARVLVKIREWLPNLKDVTGRGIELPGSSWLGPCFSVSSIPDELNNSQPSVLQQCFSNIDARRQGDIAQSLSALRMACKHVQNELNGIVKLLLGKSTRESMIQWLASTIEGNEERGKMVMDPMKAASHGFFINLNAVLLRLCGPFMDPSNPNFWKRVDVRFVTMNSRLSFTSDTKLAMSEQEEASWREAVQSASGAASTTGSLSTGPEYHFICECFFLTAKALHLGVVKIANDFQNLGRSIHHHQQDVEGMEAEAPNVPPGSRREMELRIMIPRYKEALSKLKALSITSQGVLADPDLMSEVLAFYRLMASWMICTASPQSNGNLSNIQLPLPTPPPKEFACLPEFFVEDMTDLLLHTSRYNPQLLSSSRMDEIMLFLVVFMGSPAYVKSSHLRSKMSEVLHVWLPQEDDMASSSGRPMSARRMNPRSQVGSSLQSLFQGHPMVLEHMVPTLLRLYVDVEFTDQHNQFYQKFSLRQGIAEVLQYLWNQPSHREVWRKYALREGHGTGEYVRFCNMLISDSIYLLDDSLKKLQDIKEKENIMGDPIRWLALSSQEQNEMRQSHSQTGEHLKTMLTFAQGTIHLMNFTTEEVTLPFLLPEMVDRLAGMLNYFLKFLTGSERRKLAIKEPEKYNFRPRELLLSIIKVYLHLSSSDRQGVFAKAVAADERSYSPQMFPESEKVLMSSGLLDPIQHAQLEQLNRRVEDAAAAAQEQDDLLADQDIPSEYLDPIMATLMVDPVLLPTSSKLIMDRAHIVRHLLSDQRDPSTREPLTPDMLIPQPELKAQIQAWVKQTVAAKRASKAAEAQQYGI